MSLSTRKDYDEAVARAGLDEHSFMALLMSLLVEVVWDDEKITEQELREVLRHARRLPHFTEASERVVRGWLTRPAPPAEHRERLELLGILVEATHGELPGSTWRTDRSVEDMIRAEQSTLGRLVKRSDHRRKAFERAQAAMMQAGKNASAELLSHAATLWKRWNEALLEARPRYVERPGDPTMRPPGLMENVRGAAFFMEGDIDRIQQLADRYLNQPARGKVHYRAASAKVLLTLTEVDRLSSVDPLHRDIGWMPQKEAALWVLFSHVRTDGHHEEAERVAWFMPYIFVDGDIAMAVGREVFGFPKTSAKFELPSDLKQLESARLTTTTFAERTRETEGRWGPLIDVERTGKKSGLRQLWSGMDLAVSGMREVLANPLRTKASSDLVLSGLSALATGAVPFVHLKQFRAVDDPDFAEFQGIVEAPVRLLRLHELGRLPGAYRVRFHPCASHPIVHDLGLASESVDVQAAFYIRMDFTAEPGRLVWKAD